LGSDGVALDEAYSASPSIEGLALLVGECY